MNVLSRKISLIAFVTAAGIGLFSFQNCAPPKTSSGFQSSTAGLGGQVSPSSFAESQIFQVGRCGTGVDPCDEGVYVNERDTDVSVWSCVGTGGGSSIQCSAPFSSAPVAGKCSSTVDRCDRGQFVDSADPNKWSCEGFNGGATAECAFIPGPILPKIAGVCGTKSAYTCEPGDVVKNITQPIGSSTIYWTCNGLNGGPPAPDICQFKVADPNAPVCGATDATCLGSTTTNPVSVIEVEDTDVNFVWKCSKAGYPTPITCMAPKPVCVLTVNPLTHYKDAYNFNVTVTSGQLPASVTVKYNGTKANMNGTNIQPLAVTSQSAAGGNSFAIAKVNNGGPDAGVYTRWLTIEKGGKLYCKTNSTEYTLTPRCDLSFDKTNLSTAETLIASFNFAVGEQPPLAETPYYITWYGTKNNVADETGLNVSSLSLTGNIATKTIGPFSEGTYRRYFIATSSSASNAKQLCKSEPKSFTVSPPTKVPGVCADANHALAIDTCAYGTPINTGSTGDTADLNSWKCQGANQTAEEATPCSIPKDVPITNYCATPTASAQYACVTGAIAINRAYNCNTGKYTWTCQVTNTNLTSPCEFSGTANSCPVIDDPPPGGGGAGGCSAEQIITIQLLNNDTIQMCN
ncbi:MAG: hypothetical protein K0R29_2609 [Pseudobdellovibrio sp.]|nr:hypothetical protein [Pseudobdellovibrio sp.]